MVALAESPVLPYIHPPTSAVIADREARIREAGLFLRALFGHYPDEAGFVEIRCLAPNKQPHRIARRWFPVTDMRGGENLRKAAIHCVTMAETHDVYMGVLPRLEEGWGKAEHVAWGGVFWADVDFKNVDQTDALHSLEDADVLVHSGNGLHAYWLFSRPTALDTTAKKMQFAARNENRGKKVHSDPVSDIPRILRVPGTYNHKGGADGLKRVCLLRKSSK